MHIKIAQTVLTDKSKVYDVVIRSPDSNQFLILACYSKADAEALVAGLVELIDTHACENVEAA